MRKLAVLCTIVVAMLAACASSKTTAVNDAKSALVLSADIYDQTMKTIADLYTSGKCDEGCKSQALNVANNYLTFARAMKSALDAGGDYQSAYGSIYDLISQLLEIVRSHGTTPQPNTLPRPETLRRAVATWPPAYATPSTTKGAAR